MTQAVCWKCGEPKHGAFTRCERCQSLPRTDDELALSLAFITDHYYAPADLAEITARLHAGKIPPQLTPALKEYLAPGVAEAKRMLGLDAPSPSREPSLAPPHFEPRTSGGMFGLAAGVAAVALAVALIATQWSWPIK
jgi:hypothetical protein